MADESDEHGGPAFPVQDSYIPDEHRGYVQGHYGMTLRDYFAAAALTGLIASNDEGAGDRLEDVPRYAYAIADAMLATRKAKP